MCLYSCANLQSMLATTVVNQTILCSNKFVPSLDDTDKSFLNLDEGENYYNTAISFEETA